MASDNLLTLPPELRPREFQMIRNFVHGRLGIDLRQGKERLVSARLGKHVLAGGFQSYESYLRHVEQDKTGASLLALIDAITTNHTGFLREPEHFRFLTTPAVQEFLARRPVTIWSATSSTGEEAYSILFTLLDCPNVSTSTLNIMGTDISTRALEAARAAKFNDERVVPVPTAWKQKFFQPAGPGTWQVRQQYKSLTDFRRLNLMEPFPQSAKFPIIFCRNVMIYFDAKTQTDLVQRLTAALEPGGYLIVGHAESLTGMIHSLQYVRPAVYQRVR